MNIRSLLWLMIGLWLPASAAHAGVAAVWAVGDGDKVRQRELDHPARDVNAIWDGERISLFAARNEIVAFQVIVEADASGASDVDVALESLTHSDGTTLHWKPPADDPTDTHGRHIQRFIEHYLTIDKPSPPAPHGWFYDKSAAPDDVLGRVPDALVPANADPEKGGAPFDIPASSNRGVWFDIYVPRDAPSGKYEGTVVVREANEIIQRSPVSLRVLNFALPDKTHLPVMIFFNDRVIGPRHGTDDKQRIAELIARYHRMGHRHRIELANVYIPPGTAAQLDRLSGDAFTSGRGYTGPGEGVGYQIMPASFWTVFDWKAWTDKQMAWKTADDFVRWQQRIKPNAISFLYLDDEPRGRGKMQRIKDIADHHHANPGPGSELDVFVTTEPNETLAGSIDIWATVANQVNLNAVKRQRDQGNQWWFYNGHRPYSGAIITDAPAVDSRVFAWACWKYDIPVWYYWSANHWRHNLGPRSAHHPQNVWQDPVTFDRAEHIQVNGDGVLIYPGQDAHFPKQDRNIAGPVASIRLKNIRRGVQDYEYLWLAAQHGLEKEARAIVDASVPRAFSEAKGDVAWSERGSDWHEQRRKLGQMIDGKLSDQ